MTRLILLALTLSSLLVSCLENKPLPLPKLGNFDVVYQTKNGKVSTDTIYPKIPVFHYLNEDSVLVSNKDFNNKVWIVEFFFAKCPTICPVMNNQLKKLVNETEKLKNHIQVISFTIDPKNDGPTQLKEYKIRNKITAENWVFLTGDETETHTLGIKNFLTFAGKDDDAAGGYAHSGSFTLVDKSGYVRGVYAVTNYDLTVNKTEYRRLVNDVKNLLKYEYHVN